MERSPRRPLRFEVLEERWLPTAVSWIGGSGNWDVASNWSDHAVPNSSSSVTINTTGSATITIKAGDVESIHSLTIGSKDSLSMAGGSLTTASSLSNSGTITVNPGETVTSGTFSQTSTGTLDIQLGGAPSSGDFGLLNVTGLATLGGTLKADLVSGYSPSTTDTFTPIEFAQRVGDLFQLFASQRFGLPVHRSRHVYECRDQCRPHDAGQLHDQCATPTSPPPRPTCWASIWSTGTNQPGTAQTQQMVTAAGLELYRFPGGSGSDDFHFNVANNLNDSGAITIPQFAQFISAVGGTGMVTLDYGSGSPQEAAAELAYLDGSPSDTTSIGTGLEWNDSTGQWQSVNWGTVGYWASLRAASPLATDDGLNFMRIDHPAPFTDIKYWEVGNEEYGSWEIDHHGTAAPGGVSTGAQHDPATYAAFAEQFATLAAEITNHGRPAGHLDRHRQRRPDRRDRQQLDEECSDRRAGRSDSCPASFPITATCRRPATRATPSC